MILTMKKDTFTNEFIKKNKKKKSLMPFDFNAYFISLPKL